MLTIGDKFPSFDLKAVVSHRPARPPSPRSPTRPTPASGRSCSSGRRTSPSSARPRSPPSASSTASSPTATPWSRRLHRQRVRPPGLAPEPRRPARPAVPDAGRHQARAVAALGILDKDEGVALRATFIVDPEGIIRFVVGQRPARRPQPAGSAARARRAADRRALPLQLAEGRGRPRRRLDPVAGTESRGTLLPRVRARNGAPLTGAPGPRRSACASRSATSRPSTGRSRSPPCRSKP